MKSFQNIGHASQIGVSDPDSHKICLLNPDPYPDPDPAACQ
jgi:hypothetical protein